MPIAPTGPRATSHAPRLPDFLGIGAQKAGTTWLFENLAGHSAVWTPAVKELQYFNHLYIPEHRRWTDRHRENHVRARLGAMARSSAWSAVDLKTVAATVAIATEALSDDWYARAFSPAPASSLCGEITPEYALLPEEGVAHVARLMPDVKLIFLMRDPIERAWSHIRMIAKNSPGTWSYEEIASFRDVIARCDYVKTLETWERYFDENQIFIGIYDDIGKEPQKFFEKICNFLEIDFDFTKFPNLNRVVHPGESVKMPDDVYSILVSSMISIFDAMENRFPDQANIWRSRHYDENKSSITSSSE